MPQIIALKEYQTRRIPRVGLASQTGELLYQTYGTQVDVEFPSPKTNYEWELTAQGWVGQVPITSDVVLVLEPKTPIGNLFRMLEYAYRLKSLSFPDGLVATDSLEDLYEQLADILAKRVLDRARLGFYRAYIGRSERLSIISGRMDLRQMAQRPWAVAVPCQYQEHTADIDDNQILAWTLGVILRSGVCSDRTQPTVRKAYRTLQTAVAPVAFYPQDCVRRLYNRLNDDYRPMHALSRFFLEHSGPSHKIGDRTMVPFLVNMARLYELFVAEWLQAHLPTGYQLKAQEHITVDGASGLFVNIDLTLSATASGRTLCVLDTKYKVHAGPATDDISQVVAYADLKGTREAVLIYPVPLHYPLDIAWGAKHVRSMMFSIDGDLEVAGRRFLDTLLGAVA